MVTSGWGGLKDAAPSVPTAGIQFTLMKMTIDKRTPESGLAKQERSRHNGIGPEDLLPSSGSSDASGTAALINKRRASEHLRDPSSFLAAFGRTRH